MPRPYCLGRRRAAAEQTRERIVAAARALLTDTRGFGGLSIDAVAQRAGVARMTVYYQFRSKRGLLAALLDDVAARGQFECITDALRHSDSEVALHRFIVGLAQLWTAERLMIRRLLALAVLDDEIEQGLRERLAKQRAGTHAIVEMFARDRADLAGCLDEAVDVLHVLTSFQSFDTLAGASRSPLDVVPIVHRLARVALGFASDAMLGDASDSA